MNLVDKLDSFYKYYLNRRDIHMEKPLIDYLLEEVLEIKDLTDVDKFEAEITKGNLSEISFYKIEEFVKFILDRKSVV